MTTITINRAVVEQALEALEQCGLDDTHRSHEFEHAARAALRAALAQQAEQRPMHPELRKMWEDHFDKCFRAIPVPEQAEPVEPVAWMYTGIKQDGTTHGPHLVWKPEYMDAMSASKGAKAKPLYTAPPQRKPLSEDEIEAAAKSVPAAVYELMHGHEITVGRFRAALAEVARAVERAHGIGEGA